MDSTTNNKVWHNQICNPAQLGGIEQSVLTEGSAKGVRIAWVNTGSGLRYKVVIDRAMDIAEAFFNQHSLAWLSHIGVTAPKPDANQGLEWLYSFTGGLLATCGLAHIGAPESDDQEHRGLHGRISNLPATVESVKQPDPANNKPDMSITGVVKQSGVFGPNLELKRTISARIGQASIRLFDVVTNYGSTAWPHMILYHCNFGWPLVDEGADIVWSGKWKPFGRDMDNAVFNDKFNFRKCQKPMESHRGPGEACACIDVTADDDGICTVGIANLKINLALIMKYKKQQLPVLTNWQHWGFGDYVTALEPGTNAPIGQKKAKELKELIYLEPGQSRSYELEFVVLSEPAQIEEFISSDAPVL
ncbi:MAG: aldose 1-epimerase family protein [Sedimentisphaerales bacterium]|nr:aldose 1-epimerase family protein [Sedimentisphaerales bacterium]